MRVFKSIEDYVRCEMFEQLFTLPTLLYANPNDEQPSKLMDIDVSDYCYK
jgi:hypothetical protein